MKTTTKTKTPRAKCRIERVWIEHKPDESPDYSHLGKLASQPDGWSLDRKTGKLIDSDGNVLAGDVPSDYSRGEFEYLTDFQNTGNLDGWSHVNDKGVASAWLHCRYTANHGELKHRGCNNLFKAFEVTGWESAGTRAEKIRCLDIVYNCLGCYRLCRMFRGDWQYIGVIAKAEYVSSSGISQVIRSMGLWGVESDSGLYLGDVAKEELEQLRDELSDAGFSDRAITRAFKNVSEPTYTL